MRRKAYQPDIEALATAFNRSCACEFPHTGQRTGDSGLQNYGIIREWVNSGITGAYEIRSKRAALRWGEALPASRQTKVLSIQVEQETEVVTWNTPAVEMIMSTRFAIGLAG
jgi:hypothetical protein